MTAGLTEHDVRTGYRFFLEREPESADVIRAHLARHGSIAAFREALLSSPEYLGRTGGQSTEAAATRDGYWAEPAPVVVDVAGPTLRTLLDRTVAQWRALGETEPHWSVLSDDRFRAERIAETAEDFYASGSDSARLIELFEQRAETRLSRGVCFELGCGVGRVTQALARMFDTVVAVDISPGNLRLCRERMVAEGVDNVECMLVEDLTAFQQTTDFDVLFSVIVLQHNSPPIQKLILDLLLPKIRPGGGCLFQTVTNQPGYRFEPQAYLASPDPGMEMHSLPQRHVIDLIAKHRLRLREIVADPWSGYYGSNTFFATR